MTDVLYFIQPSAHSVAKVLADFRQDDKLDYDQYGAVHFAFSQSVSQDLLK